MSPQIRPKTHQKQEKQLENNNKNQKNENNKTNTLETSINKFVFVVFTPKKDEPEPYKHTRKEPEPQKTNKERK
jgi:hypothetical protein